MDFESWTNPTVDRARQKRLALGSIFGAVTILTTVVAVAMTAKDVTEEVPEEPVMEVELAKEPEPEPQAEPEPAPEPEPEQRAPRQAGPVMPQITTPTEIPKDAPSEKAVDPNDNPYASADPYMFGGGGGTRPSAKVAEPVKAAAIVAPTETKPSGPIRVDANTTPPKALGGGGKPEYPADAKSAGIEGTVIAKFVVTESGEVTQVKAVKGPAELRAACEAYVKSLKFSPAYRDGAPVAVHQVKPCRFTLGT